MRSKNKADNLVYIQHIYDAVRRIEEYIQDFDYSRFGDDYLI